MSTKIYSGFRMVSRDLRRVLDDLDRAGKECTKVLRRRQTKYLATTATRILDNLALSSLTGRDVEPLDVSVLFAAREQLSDLQAEVRKTQMRNPDVDYELFFRLWLCRKTGSFIGYVRGEGAEEIRDLLVKSRCATEYAYWNNTDPPEALNHRQWKKREDVWKLALAGRSGPWFDIYVDEPSPYCAAEEALQDIPTFERRVTRLTDELAFERWYNTPEVDGKIEVGQAFGALIEFRSLYRDGDQDVTAMVAEVRQAVAARLAPVITAEMLSSKGGAKTAETEPVRAQVAQEANITAPAIPTQHETP